MCEKLKTKDFFLFFYFKWQACSFKAVHNILKSQQKQTMGRSTAQCLSKIPFAVMQILITASRFFIYQITTRYFIFYLFTCIFLPK